MKEEKDKKSVLKVHLTILLVVIVIFGGIVLLTGFLGNHFGKTAEMAALIAVAILLVILLFKSKRS